MWRRYAELGLLGLPFAEEYGGIGGGPVETMIVMEALGRALALEPYLATVVLGGGLLRLGGSDAHARRTAAQDRQRRYSCLPSPMPSASRATILPMSQHARAATAPAMSSTATRAWCCTAIAPTSSSSRRALPASQRDRDGIGLFLVDAASRRRVARAATRRMDGLRAAELSLNGVRVAADAVIGDPARHCR